MPSNQRKNKFVNYLPVYGSFSTGLIYIAIGVIAILSFLQLKEGGADEGSLVAFLNHTVIGKILIWVILLGTLSYIAWRIFESIKDPYGYGKQGKGIAKRLGIAFSTIPDVVIAFNTILIMLGKGQIQQNGQPNQERESVHMILDKPWGSGLIISIGIIILIAAVAQLFYGFTKEYAERMNIDRYSPALIKSIHALAWIGFLARAIIIGIMGFFLMKAGIKENAQHVVNTDKAFDYIGDEVGHLYYILVAIGTIAYGLFMFILGATYDADKD